MNESEYRLSLTLVGLLQEHGLRTTVNALAMAVESIADTQVDLFEVGEDDLQTAANNLRGDLY